MLGAHLGKHCMEITAKGVVTMAVRSLLKFLGPNVSAGVRPKVEEGRGET